MDPEPCLTWLPNGLTIHLKELHTAPIISHWVWYRVGSRYEVPGFTGISHWVEHMQFKGTPRFPTRQLDKAISRTGGNWNAFTHLDWTTYYETLPADQYALALNLERDRMINSLFDPAEVEAERTVILSELDGNENEPRHRLGQAVRKAAFDIHPYRNEVIGTKEDLQSITRDDLYRHYQHYYQPANAIIAIAGDFDTQEMLAQVAERYQDLPGSVVEPVAIQTEPPLTGERRAEITGPGGTTYLQVVYRAPAAREADFITFSLLDSLLSGATSLNMFGGGGTTNKTSRLYKTMVEKELVVSVRGGVQATIDPNTYEIACTLRPERSPDQVLQALDDQIKRLQDELVSDEEIRRAAKQARALFAYGNENITNQAFWLGYAEMFANYGWFTGYVDRLAQVTPAEIQRIAQVYLQPQHRVVGLYLPGGSAEGEHD